MYYIPILLAWNKAVHLSTDEDQICVLRPEMIFISFALGYHITRYVEGESLNMERKRRSALHWCNMAWWFILQPSLHVQAEVGEVVGGILAGSITKLHPNVVTHSPHQHRHQEKKRHLVGLHHRWRHLAIVVKPLPHTFVHLAWTPLNSPELNHANGIRSNLNTYKRPKPFQAHPSTSYNLSSAHCVQVLNQSTQEATK